MGLSPGDAAVGDLGDPDRPLDFWGGPPRPASVRHDEAYQRLHLRRAACGKATRIGMDASKRFFQLHGVDASEQAALRRHLTRAQALRFFARLPATVVATEACGAAAQHWAELTRLEHEVRLIAPQLAKPYVARGKNAAADAAAQCEAASRRHALRAGENCVRAKSGRAAITAFRLACYAALRYALNKGGAPLLRRALMRPGQRLEERGHAEPYF